MAVLGITGSIGRQTADIVLQFPERFRVVAMSTNSRVKEAVEMCRKLKPEYLVVCREDKIEEARQLLAQSGLKTNLLCGEEGLRQIACLEEIDMVVTATVGYSGLLPTLDAIKAGKDIALANKETLVVAGDYIRGMMHSSKTRIFPVDSEHSAICQCLQGEDIKKVSRLLITASGGPFRTFSKEELCSVTAADALRHPNWVMGAKITIDSATMMNKAFEIVEAHYLFGVDEPHITAVVHPQSIVHSMVEFSDGAIKAQLGVPDMRLPIAYALGLNSRLAHVSRNLTLEDMSELTFERPDTAKFPCLEFASIALNRKGNSACVINAANEIAVDAFLRNNIRFTDIPNVIEKTLAQSSFIGTPEPEDFIATNRESRTVAENIVKSLKWKHSS